MLRPVQTHDIYGDFRGDFSAKKIAPISQLKLSMFKTSVILRWREVAKSPAVHTCEFFSLSKSPKNCTPNRSKYRASNRAFTRGNFICCAKLARKTDCSPICSSNKNNNNNQHLKTIHNQTNTKELLCKTITIRDNRATSSLNCSSVQFFVSQTSFTQTYIIQNFPSLRGEAEETQKKLTRLPCDNF